MLYLQAANCKWDSCAGEAIILAMGGSFTDQLGGVIVYDWAAASYVNDKGNVCALDAELHKILIEDIAELAKSKSSL